MSYNKTVMADKSKIQTGSSDPSESNFKGGAPRQRAEEEEMREGSFRDAETRNDSKESFTDERETRMEDELTEEEPKSEKSGRTGKS
jgi:hypothetical protein